MEKRELLHGERCNEITAPEYLDTDQNLYDQEPFNNVISSLVENYQMTENNAQFIFYKIVKDPHELTALPVTPTDDLYKTDKEGQMELIYNYAKRLRDPERKKENEMHKNIKIVKTIFRELIDYPYWGEYLGVYIQQQVFNKKGERNPQRMREEVESYAKWVNDRIERRRQVTFEWEEDDKPKEAPSYDKTPKQWRILKASELMRIE